MKYFYRCVSLLLVCAILLGVPLSFTKVFDTISNYTIKIDSALGTLKYVLGNTENEDVVLDHDFDGSKFEYNGLTYNEILEASLKKGVPDFDFSCEWSITSIFEQPYCVTYDDYEAIAVMFTVQGYRQDWNPFGDNKIFKHSETLIWLEPVIPADTKKTKFPYVYFDDLNINCTKDVTCCTNLYFINDDGWLVPVFSMDELKWGATDLIDAYTLSWIEIDIQAESSFDIQSFMEVLYINYC